VARQLVVRGCSCTQSPILLPGSERLATECRKVKIYVYGYLNRVQSRRRLGREAQRNVELVWLTVG